MIRKPVVAGQFYPQTDASLRKMLAGLIEPVSEKQDAIGIIMPHAGYVYSGYVAGLTVSKVNLKKTVVILGTNHTGAGERFSIMTSGSWLTPMGEVKIDSEIATAILKESPLLKEDTLAHMYEHSIEVQLPFLQFIFQDRFEIVPVICQIKDCEIYERFAKLIVETAKKLKRKICIIASSDFTHYGFSYGFVPFTSDVKNNLYGLDNNAIDLISKFKTKARKSSGSTD